MTLIIILKICADLFKLYFTIWQSLYRHVLHRTYLSVVLYGHCIRGTVSNPAFFVDIIFHVAGFVQSCYTAALGRTTVDGGGPVDRVALQWLCMEAFRRKLGRHAGVYAAVLSVLSDRQMALRRRLNDRRLAELTRVVGNDLPADFQYILP